jgi:ubiquinone/menaquinone biosynthesis C-methylase UbiE
MSKTWQQLNNQTQPILKKLYPKFRSANDYAHDFLVAKLLQGSKVLDFGCGVHSEAFSEFKDKIHLVGVDFDNRAESANPYISEFKQADLNRNLPFDSNSFDVVYSRFVIEHLAKPERAYEEIFRVLKLGGNLILITPNLYNKIIFLSWLLPDFLHTVLKMFFVGVKETDVFPTLYHSNRASKIQRQLKSAGFSEIKITKAGGMQEYFMRSKVLFTLAVLWEKLTDHIFKFTKIHLVVVAKK